MTSTSIGLSWASYFTSLSTAIARSSSLIAPAILSPNHFGELIEGVGGIIAHTVLGNTFGSTWGFPREEYVFGTLASTAITNVTTTVWAIPSYSVQEKTTIPEYMVLEYPEEWGGEALIIAYDHLGRPFCGRSPCTYPPCYQGDRYPCCNYRYCRNEINVFGVEKPAAAGFWCSLCGPGIISVPRFSWQDVISPLKIERFYGEYEPRDSSCGPCPSYCRWDPLWECSETWHLKNVTLSAVDPGLAVYAATYGVTGTGGGDSQMGVAWRKIHVYLIHDAGGI